MKIKNIWANLAVEDLARTTEFYTRLGFEPNGSSAELISFKVGDGHFIIHFFTKERLKAGMHGKLADLEHGNEIVFSLSAESRDEVDQWVKEVKAAGGTIVEQSVEFEKGYYCVFCDPDGHRFNVLYWPG